MLTLFLAFSCDQTGPSAVDTDVAGSTSDSANPDSGAARDSGDSAADTSTDTAGDTGGSADSGGGSATAPVVTFTGFMEVGDDELSIEFTVDDADGDAEPGGLDLFVAGTTVHLAYADLATWDGRAGSVVWPVEPCEHGETWSVALTATDAVGLSDTEVTTTTLSGTSFAVTEDGDLYTDALDVGDLSAPVWICGDIDRAVDTLYVAGQDFDWFTLEPAATDHVTVSLTWTEPYADEDLYLTDVKTGGVDERAQDHTATQPEEITHELNAGTLYYVYVVGWSLPATDYVLRIE